MGEKLNEVIRIKENDIPFFVDPKLVGCGFALFPKECASFFKEVHVNQALQTNKQSFGQQLSNLILQFQYI